MYFLEMVEVSVYHVHLGEIIGCCSLISTWTRKHEGSPNSKDNSRQEPLMSTDVTFDHKSISQAVYQWSYIT